MSDLLSLLSLGGAGIAAQSSGVAVAGNNVANANTQGYTRQRVDLQALQAASASSLGGVRSLEPTRIANTLLETRIVSTAGALAMSRAFADALSDAEMRLTGGGAMIDEQLSTLYTNISQVSAMPTDDNLRGAVVSAARALVSGIHRRAAEVATARKEADTRLRDRAAQATSLAKQLAGANKDLRGSADPTLRDRRDQLAKQLSEVVGGQARIDPDGQMRFVLDGGAVLVDGPRASQLQTSPDAATGVLRIDVVDGASRRNVTNEIVGGAMGADIAVRDRTLPGITAKLDQLAYDVTASFNAVHTVNAGKDGVTGRPMFTPLTSVDGAASAIAVDPALAADPKLLATATPGTGPGDNKGALALFALSSQKTASGGTRTATDAALDIVGSLAIDTAAAKDDVARDEAVSQHLAGLRDSISGVDIQEEMTNLAKFENVASAMTRFVSTVDGLLGDLIDRL